jgi:hypothetical protein
MEKVQADFERELRELTGRLEAVTAAAGPLFDRIEVARQVFGALTAGRSTDEVASLAAECGHHGLCDALDAHAGAFEVATGAYVPGSES